MWRGTMYQGKMSEAREVELRLWLQEKSLFKLKLETVNHVVNTINMIREDKIKVYDWLPDLVGVVRYYDMLESFGCEEFLTDGSEFNEEIND
jgi:hypothetical protein